MFIVRDWILGALRDDDDDDFDLNDRDNEKTDRERKRHRTNDYERNTTTTTETRDYVNEEGGGEEYVDYAFLEELEDLHNFSESELINFYVNVRKAYSYELLSSWKDRQHVITRYVHSFLFYLCTIVTPEASHQQIQMSDTIVAEKTCAYPRILYHRSDEITPSAYCICVDGEELSTFRVDKRLDFVYTYVLEKAIVDALDVKCELLMGHHESLYDTGNLDGLLDEIEQNKDLYRTRSSARYNGLRETMSSDAWVLYTRRSSSFFKACIAIVESHNEKTEMKLVYSVETLNIETIPFQQVLLLCGTCAGFSERYTRGPCDSDGPFVADTEEALDWVSVPIWFSLLVSLNQ